MPLCSGKQALEGAVSMAVSVQRLLKAGNVAKEPALPPKPDTKPITSFFTTARALAGEVSNSARITFASCISSRLHASAADCSVAFYVGATATSN